MKHATVMLPPIVKRKAYPCDSSSAKHWPKKLNKTALPVQAYPAFEN